MQCNFNDPKYVYVVGEINWEGHNQSKFEIWTSKLWGLNT